MTKRCNKLAAVFLTAFIASLGTLALAETDSPAARDFSGNNFNPAGARLVVVSATTWSSASQANGASVMGHWAGTWDEGIDASNNSGFVLRSGVIEAIRAATGRTGWLIR